MLRDMNRPRPDPDADDILLRRLIGGDPAAGADLVQASAGSDSVGLLVAAGMVAGDSAPMLRAADLATTMRERQLVALAQLRLEGPAELFDALILDHLASYPDHLLAAWLAGHRILASTDPKEPTP